MTALNLMTHLLSFAPSALLCILVLLLVAVQILLNRRSSPRNHRLAIAAFVVQFSLIFIICLKHA